MKKFLATLLVAIMMVMPFTMVGCSNANKIRLCEVTHSIFYAPLYVAINNGYFTERGLTVELTNGGGADKVMTAVVSGQSDIGLAGPESCVYVYNQGKEDYPVIFAQLTKRDGSFLVGRTDEDFSWENYLR